jgi:hypothetical protein
MKTKNSETSIFFWFSFGGGEGGNFLEPFTENMTIFIQNFLEFWLLRISRKTLDFI